MAKSHSFSIYLLKEQFDASNSLEPSHSLQRAEAAQLPPGARVFIVNAPSHPPWWKGYLGVTANLLQVAKAAILFVPANRRNFAFTFGQVRHNLRDESYEYDFGLRVTLNSVDADFLKNTDSFEPGTARRQRTQVAAGRSLAHFDFDRDNKILKSLTGRTKKAFKDLVSHVSGASSVRVSSPVLAEELPQLCDWLLKQYKAEVTEPAFVDLLNIIPVKDPEIVGRLDEKLLDALHAESTDFYLTVPELVDYQDTMSVEFRGAGSTKRYDDAFLARYYDYLRKNEIDPGTLNLEHLKRHVLMLVDENGGRAKAFKIFKCLVFDTKLDEANQTYYLTDGQWYQVADDYIARLKSDLDPYWCEPSLPPYEHARESAYNKETAAISGMLCLDMCNVAPKKQTQVEPCDLYAVKEGRAVLHHVKVSTFSAALSHLFNQGANAVELMRRDPEALERMRDLVVKGSPPELQDTLLAPLAAPPVFAVEFDIVTHKDPHKRSDNLPLFSRISLRRCFRALHGAGVPASFGFVQNNTEGKTAGSDREAHREQLRPPEGPESGLRP